MRKEIKLKNRGTQRERECGNGLIKAFLTLVTVCSDSRRGLLQIIGKFSLLLQWTATVAGCRIFAASLNKKEKEKERERKVKLSVNLGSECYDLSEGATLEI